VSELSLVVLGAAGAAGAAFALDAAVFRRRRRRSNPTGPPLRERRIELVSLDDAASCSTKCPPTTTHERRGTHE
jgi:hypothetical protein